MDVLATDTMINDITAPAEIKRIRTFHKELTLCHDEEKDLLSLSDDIILYVISLLSDKHPAAPSLSTGQWKTLVWIFSQHRISPLIYKKLEQVPAGSRPPGDIMELLKHEYLRSTKSAILLDRQFKELVDAFDKEKLPFLALKGAALSRSIYADPAIRPCTDIDFLFRQGSVNSAKAIMNALGYTGNADFFGTFKDFYCEESYAHNSLSRNYTPVEIHWTLNPVSLIQNLSNEQLFERSITVNYGALSFKALDRIDTLIHLSMHIIYNHNTEIRLMWIYDIFTVGKSFNEGDWDELRLRCIQNEAIIPVQKALLMANYWAGLTVPANIDKWPAPSQNELDAFNYITRSKDNTASQFKLLWPRKASIGQKCKILFYLILPPPEMLRLYEDKEKKRSLPILHIKRWYRLTCGLFKKQ